MGELYKLDFPNGKSYIGITKKTAAKRFKGHSQAARLGCRNPLYNAWRKHGEPTLMILAVLEDDDLHAAEIRAIKVFGTLLPGGYNATIGGDSGCKQAPHIIEKLKAASKRRWNRPEEREKNRKAATAQFKTKEARDKHAELSKKTWERPEYNGNRGNKHTEEWKQSQSERKKKMFRENPAKKQEMTNCLRTDESRRKAAASLKERWKDQEYRKKMSEAHKGLPSPNKGKKLSEEQKAKISQSVKLSMQKRKENV